MCLCLTHKSVQLPYVLRKWVTNDTVLVKGNVVGFSSSRGRKLPHSLTLTPAQPRQGHKCNLQIQFPIIGSLVQNEFWIIRCITHRTNYRLRKLKCVFQHLNVVTAVNGYEMMLLLALKCCPGLRNLGLVTNQQIVEMLDVLISNAAYTGRDD